MNGRILIAVATAAALAACGGPAEQPESAAEAEAAETAYTAPPPAAATAAGERPAFAPAYPGATVVANMSAVQDGRPGGVYAFQTADAPDKVFAFYRAKAEAAGLATNSNVGSAAGKVYAAAGEAGNIAVTVAPAEGQNYVQVTWSAN